MFSHKTHLFQHGPISHSPFLLSSSFSWTVVSFMVFSFIWVSIHYQLLTLFLNLSYQPHHSYIPNASTSMLSSSKLSVLLRNFIFHASNWSHSSSVILFTHTQGSSGIFPCRAIAPILCCVWAILRHSFHPHQASWATNSGTETSSVSSPTL